MISAPRAPSLDRAVGVPTLAVDIVLCFWTRRFTLTVAVSTATQMYKLVPANEMLGGNSGMDQHPFQGGVKILLVV